MHGPDVWIEGASFDSAEAIGCIIAVVFVLMYMWPASAYGHEPPRPHHSTRATCAP